MELKDFLWSLITIYVCARVLGELAVRIGQSAVLGELLAELELGGPFTSAAEAFAWLAAEEPRFGGLSYELLGTRGAVVPAGQPAGVSA